MLKRIIAGFFVIGSLAYAGDQIGKHLYQTSDVKTVAVPHTTKQLENVQPIEQPQLPPPSRTIETNQSIIEPPNAETRRSLNLVVCQALDKGFSVEQTALSIDKGLKEGDPSLSENARIATGAKALAIAVSEECPHNQSLIEEFKSRYSN